MSKLAMVIGVVYILIGVTLALFPEWFLSVVDWESRQGLYVAAGIRVVVGAVLLLAASTLRFPGLFRFIGALALAAGLMLALAPIEFWGQMMRWWVVDHATLFRTATAIGATLFGAFIVYSATPKGAAV